MDSDLPIANIRETVDEPTNISLAVIDNDNDRCEIGFTCSHYIVKFSINRKNFVVVIIENNDLINFFTKISGKRFIKSSQPSILRQILREVRYPNMKAKFLSIDSNRKSWERDKKILSEKNLLEVLKNLNITDDEILEIINCLEIIKVEINFILNEAEENYRIKYDDNNKVISEEKRAHYNTFIGQAIQCISEINECIKFLSQVSTATLSEGGKKRRSKNLKSKKFLKKRSKKFSSRKIKK
jgi:hypothetical protein